MMKKLTLIVVVFILKSNSVFSQCSGSCTHLNPAVLPPLIPGVVVCITSDITYPGATTVSGGSISICNGAHVSFNGSLKIDSGFITLNECASFDVNGTIRNFETSGDGIIVLDACNCDSAVISTGPQFGFPVICGSPLPVELNSFELTLLNSDVIINWSTASEINNSHFVLQRSKDGYTWNDIAMINGSGYSNQLIDYQYIDLNLKPGLYYYRLIQFDYNGSIEIFETKSIKVFDEMETHEVSYQYNPGSNSISITTLNENTTQYKIEFIDFSGRICFSQSILTSSINSYTIPTNQLKSGIYIIRISNDYFTLSEKLLVQ